MAQKSFKFKLQSVLDYKQDLEDKEKEKLAKILQELDQAIKHRDFLLQKREQARLELKDKQKKGDVNVNELRFYTNYLKKLDQDIVQANINIETIRAREKEQRQVLLEAAKQRKIYEKLKEKHKEQFEEEIAQAERKLIDEMATVKFARKQQAELEMREAIERGEMSWEDI